MTTELQAPRTIYTVSELNGRARLVLSTQLGTVWVEGEISNLSQPSSGHLYFTLKDRDAQVRCALFRGSVRGLACRPQNGIQVLVRAQVTLYEPRGDYQLVVDYLEEAGDGALRRAYEALKLKLAGEGLFDPARKTPLPALPRCVGIVTSPTGAAVRDVLHVLARRFPALPVLIFPTKVQGREAAAEIAGAIGLAERCGLCDVLLLARGGGSLEDLWAYNEEIVARAIAACSIPIVSGVGHETDTTIADLAADLRAPTPSAAAEAVSPDRVEWLARCARLESQLRHPMRVRLEGYARTLLHLESRLRLSHPRRALDRNAQKLDELELRLQRAHAHCLTRHAARFSRVATRLLAHRPDRTLTLLAARRDDWERRLNNAIRSQLQHRGMRLAQYSEKLHTVSPLATLARGYSITLRRLDGKALLDASEVEKGELIETRFAASSLISRVE
ncbi:exodeoxyribonuclease VII large subunit [Methylococcus sp. EFPC2]|uniref:exodeoxyribonuclease VII large subunit n=1 Tax=Methylococcus sp. EFPC2 TaxID=2812648 RepID=UPI001967ED53|nr:exodeoxyribonuclease VII large subunit [Methylococcus sp. EFPC2]QSA98703.1 exodeoxyribonuclease VII large subunit [Methylococcus sp. EFPC2]